MKITHVLLTLPLVAASAPLHATDHRTAAGGASELDHRFLQVTQAGAAFTDGEVRKVDSENGKITIRHGEIRNLEMPPMTMVFQVKDPAMLDKVKTGDKVRFVAEMADGEFAVSALEVVR